MYVYAKFGGFQPTAAKSGGKMQDLEGCSVSEFLPAAVKFRLLPLKCNLSRQKERHGLLFPYI